MSGRILIGLYAILVALGLLVIGNRASRTLTIKGVSSPRWLLARPSVSYLATQTLHIGHRVREQDLKAPAVSQNLASALPNKAELVGKYALRMINAGDPVL